LPHPFPTRRSSDLVARRLELHGAGDKGEERVVFADADVIARQHPCAPLADDDRPRFDPGARVFLYAEPLPSAVPSVASRTRAFLVCHFPMPRSSLCGASSRPAGGRASSATVSCSCT